jgi:hypothetical protein
VPVLPQTVKGIVHTLQPKQVDLHEIAVGWKLEQTVTRAGRAPEHCVATIELRRDGTVRTRYRGEEMITDYTFRQHSWPRACTIEFDAYAFQGPHDPEPVLKHYKGEFSRNLMDSSIITMKGAIYDLQVGWTSHCPPMLLPCAICTRFPCFTRTEVDWASKYKLSGTRKPWLAPLWCPDLGFSVLAHFSSLIVRLVLYSAGPITLEEKDQKWAFLSSPAACSPFSPPR